MSPLLPLVYKMTGHVSSALGLGSAFAVAAFRDEISLGAVIITAALLVIAGLFTIRSNIARVWREDAEGQKAAKEHLAEELRIEREVNLKEQGELKAQLLAAKAENTVLEAKTDLGAALESIRAMNAELAGAVATRIASSIEENVKHGKDRDDRIYEILSEIRDRLPTTPS